MRSKLQYTLFGVALTFLTVFVSLSPVEQKAEANPSAEEITQLTPTPNIISTQAEPSEVLDRDISVAPIEQQVTSHVSDVANPETSFDIVIAQVRELADKYESATLGKAGWLYRVSDYYFPARYLSNTGMIEGTPVSEIRPQDLMRKEEWFLVNEDGSYTTGITHDVDEQGEIRRRWAQTNGKAANLSLPSTSEYRVQDWSQGHVSLHAHPLWYLGVARDNNQTVKAWREGDTYIVVVTVVEEKPVEVGNVGITAISIEKQWVFDLTTGAFRSSKDSLQADDGTWVPGESWVILSQEMVTQPSSQAIDTLMQAEQVMQETR